MRCGLVVRASDCHCRSRKQSWVRSQYPPTQWNMRGSIDEAVLNTVHKKIPKNPLLIKLIKRLIKNIRFSAWRMSYYPFIYSKSDRVETVSGDMMS